VTNDSTPWRSILRGKRIAIFQPHRDSATNPSIVALIHELERSGVWTDLFMSNPGALPSFSFGRTRIFPFVPDYPVGKFHRGLWRDLWTLHRERVRFTEGRMVGVSVEVLSRLRAELAFRIHAERLFRRRRYDLLIGVDSAGIVAASEYGLRFGVPYVYWSFEIFFRDELVRGFELATKKAEIPASRGAAAVLIQDPNRAKLLAEENGLDLAKFLFLPVAPAGQPAIPPSDYFRKSLGLEPETRIILHPGSFADWTCAAELIDASHNLRPGLVVVVHTKYRPGRNDPWIKRLRERQHCALRLSDQPLTMEAFEAALESVDLGAVLYRPVVGRYTQRNLANVGLSSGKFSMFMRHGIPVICLPQTIFRELETVYGFGAVIGSLEELAPIAESILSDRSHYSAEARRLYRERLDFNLHWPDVARRLESIMRMKPTSNIGRRAPNLL
jgi:hypothetical protein